MRVTNELSPCDASNNNEAFISRTLQAIKQYKSLVNSNRTKGQKIPSYNRTLFVNCCLSLLFIPRDTIYDDELFNTPAGNWGIKTRGIFECNNQPDQIPVKDLVRHLRNSLAHSRMEFNYDGRKVLQSIHFKDYKKDKLTFDATINYKDFEALVTLLAENTLEVSKKGI